MHDLPLLVNIALVAIIVALVAVAMTTLVLAQRRSKGPAQITLPELAVIWTKDGKGEVHIESLAPLWREEDAQTGPDYDSLQFNCQRITDFVEQHIKGASWFRNTPTQAEITLKILSMLDNEGGCPSVVNVSGDVEAKWDAGTYGTLAQVTLRDHTLNVAEETIKALRESGAAHIIPDALIAALGHDLGKLPSSQGYLYSLGEHPLAAGKAMATIREFKELPKKEEILRAIKMHHKMPEGLLGKTIKAADQKARQKETEDVLAIQTGQVDQPAEVTQPKLEPTAPPATPTPANDLPAAPPEPPPALVPAPTHTPSAAPDVSKAAWRAEEAIYGHSGGAAGSEKKQTGPPQMVDISLWFDAKDFLEGLEPYINKLYGRRWMAFSMSDGYVYIQPKAMEEVIRRQAEQAGAMDIANMAPDDETMRQVLFTVVQKLRVEHQDVLARGLIKDNFFGGYFEITMRNGKKLKGFYTPFHAEAFGSIAEMEAKKKSPLTNFASVEPSGKKED